MKNNSFKMLAEVLRIFLVDTKITFVYNFVGPLRVDYQNDQTYT